MLAEVYALNGEVAKADSCWQEALKEKDENLHAQILKKYITWLQQQGRHHDATEMTQQLFTIKESLQGKQKAENLYKIQSEYEKVQVEQHNTKIHMFGMIVIFISVTLVLFFSGHYIKRKHVVRNLLSKNQEQIEKYERMISEKEESIDTANVSVVSFKEVTMATPTFNSHHPNQSAAIKTHA